MDTPKDATRDALRIEHHDRNDGHRFVIAGDLDLASAPEIRATVLAALTTPGRTVVVDISQVRFLDCTAIGMLLEILRHAEQTDCTLRVTGASGVPLEVLEIAGVAKRLGIYDQADHLVDDSTGPAVSGDLVSSMLDTISELTPDSDEHHQLRDRVIADCTPYATTLARRFTRRGEPFDDLNQVAMVGLLKAVDRYDPHRGREFVAYAKPTILGELRRHFRDRTWSINVPRRHKEMRLALNAAREDLTHKLGSPPSVAQLADYLEVSPQEVLDALEASRAHQSVSLSTPVTEEAGTTLADLIGGPDPEFEAVENRATLPHLIAQLNEREQRILTLRFYGNMTQSEIAQSIGISQMHVSRLLKAALGRLREELSHED